MKDCIFYVENNCSLDTLPASLMKQFGRATRTLTFVLTPDKKLANADSAKVIAAIKSHHFYLQMPPKPEAYMQGIANDKMRVS